MADGRQDISFPKLESSSWLLSFLFAIAEDLARFLRVLKDSAEPKIKTFLSYDFSSVMNLVKNTFIPKTENCLTFNREEFLLIYVCATCLSSPVKS